MTIALVVGAPVTPTAHMPATHSLSSNQIDDKAAIFIGKALTANTLLKELK